MSSEHVERVRAGYRAWNQGDVGRAVELLDHSVEWEGHPELPAAGPFESRDEVERWLIEFREVWEEVRAEPLAFIDSGDEVVALVQVFGRGKGSGVEVQGGVDAHVWTWRGGRIVRVTIQQGAETFLQALSDDERELLRLRFAERRSVSELAERLKIPEAEVEHSVDRAMEKLGAVPAQ